MNCPGMYYSIKSDCGECLNTTQLNSANCSLLPIGSECKFAVACTVCKNITGNWSSPVLVKLKGIDFYSIIFNIYLSYNI